MGQAQQQDWNRGPSPWKGAALGAVIERSEHAYGIASRLQHRLPAARLTAGDLYPVLKRLEASGLVTVTKTDGAQPKGIYHVTRLGIEEFERWLRTPSAALPPVRNELLVKLAVARTGSRQDLEAVLKQLDDAHAELLAQLATADADEDEDEIDAAASPTRALAQTLHDAQRDHALAHWQADLMVIDRTRRRLRRLLESQRP